MEDAYRYMIRATVPPRDSGVTGWDIISRHVKPVNTGHLTERPATAKRFPNKPHTFRHGPFSAVSIDTDQAIWDEAEALEHCISGTIGIRYRTTYKKRMDEGRYVAYHIRKDLDPSHAGWTAGFVLHASDWILDDVRGHHNQTAPSYVREMCDRLAVEIPQPMDR